MTAEQWERAIRFAEFCRQYNCRPKSIADCIQMCESLDNPILLTFTAQSMKAYVVQSLMKEGFSHVVFGSDNWPEFEWMDESGETVSLRLPR